MNKAFPLLETLIHYHSKEYHDSKLISVFHWRMIQNCFSVKHTNGEVNIYNIHLQNILLMIFFQVNELIDWGNAMEGLGVTIIEYENVDIRLHCTFENHNDKLQINMVILPPLTFLRMIP
jgi:hypothetical protein